MCIEVGVRNDGVDQADIECMLGAEPLAFDHEHFGSVSTDEAWKSLAATGTRKKPKSDLGEADGRRLRHDAEVAGQRQFCSAAECVPVDLRDNRFGSRLEDPLYVDPRAHRALSFFRQLTHHRDVRTGDEEPSRARHDNGADGLIRREYRQYLQKLGDQAGVERVGWRFVDSHGGNRVCDVDGDEPV